MANLGKIVYLTDSQLATMMHDGSITVDGQTITYSENDIYMTPSQPNIPAGGNTGDVLTKINTLNYNVAWTPPFTPLDAYPIGSIYMSIVNTNPSIIFGGTWVSFGEGRVLVGVDANDEDFESAMLDGGEKTVTLTVDEMPNHGHELNIRVPGSGGAGAGAVTWASATSSSPPYQAVAVGGDQPHNNMPPYITCYMWRRTA